MVGGRKQYKDIKGAGERGPRDFKARVVEKEGDVMLVAQKNVLTVHPNAPIVDVAKLMRDNDFRRLPVTDAGTNRLLGLAVAIDILDFLGGGEKYNIIEEDYNGNFLSAINCPINKIMANASYVTKRDSIGDVADIVVKKHTSAIPVVEDKNNLKVVAIVTERDVLPDMESLGVSVGDVMKKKVITATLGMTMSDVAKVMVRNRLRRLPVVSEDKVVGVVTVFDVLGYVSKGEFKGVLAEENLNTRVDEIISRDVVSVKPSQDLAEVVKMVHETGFGGFPVMEDNRLAGIVTTTDVLETFYSLD